MYGYHQNYDVAVTTKVEVTTKDDVTSSNEVYVAILMAHSPRGQGGTVLAITESRSDGGADAGHTSAVNRIGGELETMIAGKLGESQDEGRSGLS